MLRGFHLANNGNITDEHLDWLQGVEMVKCLVRLDLPAEPTGFQRLHESLPPHTEFVLRLYMPGRWSAEEFVQRTQERLPRILSTLGDRTTWIEIHNEPNHKDGIEGWGKGMEHVTTFIPWYHYVLSRFRCIGFQNLGFPGLALGGVPLGLAEPQQVLSERAGGVLHLARERPELGCQPLPQPNHLLPGLAHQVLPGRVW